MKINEQMLQSMNEKELNDLAEKIQKLLDLRQKRLVLSQYEERLNNILNEIRALGYNIFMDNWFEEPFDENFFLDFKFFCSISKTG